MQVLVNCLLASAVVIVGEVRGPIFHLRYYLLNVGTHCFL